MLRDGFNGFHSIRAFRGDFNLRMRLQKLANYVARQLFVIDDERLPSFVWRGAHAFSSLSAGSDKVTLKSLPSVFTLRLASFPYRASIRCCTFFSTRPPDRRDGVCRAHQISTSIPKHPCSRSPATP